MHFAPFSSAGDLSPAAAALNRALTSSPLMVEPGYLDRVLASLGGGSEMSWFAGRWDPQNRMTVTDDGIACVRVSGLLVNRGPWLGQVWGMTSYEGLAEQLRRCAADRSIKHILLDIDSGGGMVAGIWDLMPTIAEAREKKPVTAIANAWACSAAYAIGCAAGELYVNRSSTTGSIGVIRAHFDMSEAMTKWGVKPTMIKAGRMKDAGSPYRPLDAESLAYLQADVDDAYETFTAHVAGCRSLSQDAVKATEARVYGAADACALGLADGVMSLEETLDHIRVPRKARTFTTESRAQTPTGASMSANPAGVGLSQADLDRIAAAVMPARAVAQVEATVTKAEAERMAEAAAAKATSEAKAAERKRIADITAHDAAKGREAVALNMALTTDLTVDQAAGLLASMPKAEAKAEAPANPLAAAMRNPANSAHIKPDAAGATDANGGSQRPSLAAKAAKFGKRRPVDDGLDD